MGRSALIHISETPQAARSDARIAPRGAPAVDVTNDNTQTDAEGPVFVIDDDDWVCDSLKALLETYGFAVETYASGAEFLADPRRGTARCLVVDQHMPAMTGLDTIAALHRDGIFPRVIVITGLLETATATRAAALGVVAVLEKPFPAARLVELVRSAATPRA